MQVHNHAVVTVRAQTDRVAITVHHSKAENLLVELERTVEICDLQSHSPETCGIRKPIPFGTDAVLSMLRHNVIRAHSLPPSRLPPPATPRRPRSCDRARKS